MLTPDFRICKKCGKSYVKFKGGIIANPTSDYWDPGLCKECTTKEGIGKVKKIIEIITK